MCIYRWFSPGPLGRKTSQRPICVQSVPLFFSLCGKKIEVSEVLQVVPKKKVGKKDGGNGTMPVISVAVFDSMTTVTELTDTSPCAARWDKALRAAHPSRLANGRLAAVS